MEIRVKSDHIDGHTKKELKKWGFKVIKIWGIGVKLVKFPSNITLEEGSALPGIYFIKTKSGRNLGHSIHPFEFDGGTLTFAP